MKSLGYLSAFLGGGCGGFPEEAQHQAQPQGSG